MTVDDRPGWSIYPAQRLAVDGVGRRYTDMYETKNETNRRPVTCRREAGPDDLTFRFRSGFAGPGASIIVRCTAAALAFVQQSRQGRCCRRSVTSGKVHWHVLIEL
jgi:hypothetical protein